MTEYSFRDSPGYWHDKYEKLKAENAKLREDNDYLMSSHGEACNAIVAERDRLREAPCDLHTELREENARLREERDEAERRAQVNLEDANRGWAENARLRELFDSEVRQHNRDILQRDALRAAFESFVVRTAHTPGEAQVMRNIFKQEVDRALPLPRGEKVG